MQRGLGSVYNASPAADGKWINLRDAGAVAFICYLTGAAGDTYTLQEAKDSGGTGAQNLLAFTEYFTNTGDGSDAWTKRTQAAAATVVTAASATQNAMVCEVMASKLSDTYDWVKLTSTGSGAVTALTHHLSVQRSAANLPAMGV
jgi:hypothetical protein